MQRRRLATGGADHHPHECDGRAHLGEQGAQSGARDPQPLEQAGAVDEDDVEHDVGEVARDRHHERRPGVLEPAQHAGGGEHQQHRHGPHQRDVQVGDGQVLDPRTGAEQPHHGAGQRQRHRGDQGSDQGGEPEAVDALRERTAAVPRTDLAGHRRGGAVGQEDAQAHQGAQHRGGDAERRELRRAEVTDDGGVGEQEERLRDQGQEGRDGEPEDLAVVGAVRWLGRSLGRSPGRDHLVRARSLPRGEARRCQNLCKTRGSLWVSRFRGALSTNERDDARWPCGEYQQARKLLSTSPRTTKPQVRGGFAKVTILGSTAAPTGCAPPRRRVPHDQQGYPQAPVDDALGGWCSDRPYCHSTGVVRARVRRDPRSGPQPPGPAETVGGGS